MSIQQIKNLEDAVFVGKKLTEEDVQVIRAEIRILCDSVCDVVVCKPCSSGDAKHAARLINRIQKLFLVLYNNIKKRGGLC